MMASTEYFEYFEEDVKMEINDKKRIHLVNHKCDICSKDFKSKSVLRKHIQAVHEEIKYPCNRCEFKSTQKGNLQTHIESVHEKIKHSCILCKYKATAKRTLKTLISSYCRCGRQATGRPEEISLKVLDAPDSSG